METTDMRWCLNGWKRKKMCKIKKDGAIPTQPSFFYYTFLQLFSFICLLSFDVYLKKQMIEHMVDELASLAAPSDPKKKN